MYSRSRTGVHTANLANLRRLHCSEADHRRRHGHWLAAHVHQELGAGFRRMRRHLHDFVCRLSHTGHVGAFTERDMLRRFSHWLLRSHSLTLSLSQLLRHGMELHLHVPMLAVGSKNCDCCADRYAWQDEAHCFREKNRRLSGQETLPSLAVVSPRTRKTCLLLR